jgi:hypothetical protein
MAFLLAPFLAKSLPGIGVFGGLIGGAAAMVKNVQLLRDGKVTQSEAALDTGKEAVGAGLATAFSAAVAGAVGSGLVVSLGVAVVAGFAGKFAWDRCTEFAEGKLASARAPVTTDDELILEAE